MAHLKGASDDAADVTGIYPLLEDDSKYILQTGDKNFMNFLCFGDKNKKSILFIHGMASTAMLCYEPILKRLSDYYVILAEVDGHSERTGELVSLEKDCDEIEDYIKDNLSGNIYMNIVMNMQVS